MLKSTILSFCFLTAAGCCFADDATRVRVQYDSIVNGKSTHWDVRLVLSGNGTVQENASGSSRSGQGNFNTGGSLGRSNWRVRSNNQIERVITTPTHYQTTLVSVSGGSCSAEISLRMKPGQTTYMVTRLAGGWMQSDRPRYENVRCSIQ